MTARAAIFAALIALGCTHGFAGTAQTLDDPQTATVSPERVFFLADKDLPDGTWLLLMPLAIGGYGDHIGPDFRIIRDTAALRAAAPHVWVENDEAAKLRLLLLSTIFLSPPANGLGDEFALIVFPDGRTQSVVAFHPAMQDRFTAPPHDLAGLLQISEPAFSRFVRVFNSKDYADLVTRISTDPDMYTLEPLPPENTLLAFSTESDLVFPSLLMRDTELTEARMAEESVRAEARFAETFGPPGTGYDPFTVTAAPCGPGMVMDVATDMPVMVEGEPLFIPGFSALSLGTTLYSDAALPERVSAAAPGFSLGQQVTAEFDAAFAAVLQDNLDTANMDAYYIDLYCWSGQLQAVWPRENVGYVSYYRIGQSERE